MYSLFKKYFQNVFKLSLICWKNSFVKKMIILLCSILPLPESGKHQTDWWYCGANRRFPSSKGECDNEIWSDSAHVLWTDRMWVCRFFMLRACKFTYYTIGISTLREWPPPGSGQVHVSMSPAVQFRGRNLDWWEELL